MYVREVDPSKVRLRGLLEAAPDAIFVTDADDTVVMVNAQMERLFAQSRAELVGQPGRVLFPAAFQPIYNSYHNAFYYAVLPAPERTSAELWGRGPSGKDFPLEITMSPLETETGKMVTNVIRDISERKRMEAALRESEARFRRLAENAQDVIYRFRLWPAFAVEYVSPSVTAVCGFRPDEFYADRDLALRCVHPEDVPQIQKI
ncbi:MAG TPA: PAS domain S-box protein, partial [Planctomycetota bacterium]|nr:PAS domain S-box protein [Planctomycetota bacterium]